MAGSVDIAKQVGYGLLGDEAVQLAKQTGYAGLAYPHIDVSKQVAYAALSDPKVQVAKQVVYALLAAPPLSVDFSVEFSATGTLSVVVTDPSVQFQVMFQPTGTLVINLTRIPPFDCQAEFPVDWACQGPVAAAWTRATTPDASWSCSNPIGPPDTPTDTEGLLYVGGDFFQYVNGDRLKLI